MKRLVSPLAYSAAALTIAAAILSPFVLFGGFAQGVAALGLHVDDTYTGGQPAFAIVRPAYRIEINRPVVPRGTFTRVRPFVQVAWIPASALPSRVSEELDLDGDGRPDAVVTFAVPQDPSAGLSVEVSPRSPRVHAMHAVARASFGALIARVGDRIVVRVPMDAT